MMSIEAAHFSSIAYLTGFGSDAHSGPRPVNLHLPVAQSCCDSDEYTYTTHMCYELAELTCSISTK